MNRVIGSQQSIDHARVAVGLPDGPRTDDAGVGPGGAKVPAVLKRKRSVTGKRAAGPLRFHQLAKPLRVERTDVGVVGRRGDVGLCVAGPAHSFIALRTIGRQVEEVGPLRPDDVAEQLIDHRVGALERAGQRRVASAAPSR